MLKMTMDFVSEAKTVKDVKNDVQKYFNKVDSVNVLHMGEQSLNCWPEVEIIFDVENRRQFNSEVARQLFNEGIEDTSSMESAFETLTKI